MWGDVTSDSAETSVLRYVTYFADLYVLRNSKLGRVGPGSRGHATRVLIVAEVVWLKFCWNFSPRVITKYCIGSPETR